MGVGRFRTRATFSTRDTTLDSFGQESTSLTQVLQIGADVRELRGNERQSYSDGVETVEEFLSLRIPFRTAIDSIPNSAVISIDNALYVIVGRSSEFTGINQYLRFIVRRER